MEILNKLKPNPDNPRTITDEDFTKLKAKIKEFPQMLEKRPIIYDKDFVVIGGNQRLRALRALSKEGFEIKESYFSPVTDWTAEQIKQFIITDNISDGKWDYDIIANNWSDLPLAEWGLDIEGWINGEETDPNKEWSDMPEFDGTPAFNAYKSIMVHFETEDDYKNFADLINQKMTDKTKYIWYPFKEKEVLIDKAFKNE